MRGAAAAATILALLLGAADASALSVSNSSLTFANQAVGSTSAPQSITLTACPPGTRCTMSSIAGMFYLGWTTVCPASSGNFVQTCFPSVDYIQTNDCPASMAPGTSCTMQIRFRPAKTGPRPVTLHTGYDLLLPAFVLMGIGMALTMSPMSTAAMNAVAPQKAGVASGILSMSRMVGGTFGVAALGALFQHLARNDLAGSLAGTGISAAQREHLVSSLGTASDGASLPPVAAAAAHNAFIHALASGMWLSAGVAALGAVIAFRLIGDKPVRQPDAVQEPEAAAAVAEAA